MTDIVVDPTAIDIVVAGPSAGDVRVEVARFEVDVAVTGGAGPQGLPGAPGAPGAPGPPGDDGVSTNLVNVKDHGAIGNGTTDDTAAINAAVAAVGSGGVLYFPEGTYLASLITFGGNTTVMGDGAGVSIIRQSVDVPNWTFGTLYFEAKAVGTQLRDIRVCDLSVHGPDIVAPVFSEHKPLMSIHGVRSMVVERVHFVGWMGDAITLASGATLENLLHNNDIIIRDCDFDGVTKNNRNAISVVDGDGITIEGNTFTRCTRDDMPGAVDVEPDPNGFDFARNVTVRNNLFNDVGGTSGAIGFQFFNGLSMATEQSGFLVEGNRISNSPNGVTFWSQAGSSGLGATARQTMLVITNNIIADTVHPFGVSNARGFVVEGNTITRASGQALVATIADPSIRSFDGVVANNFFNHCGGGEGVALTLGNASYVKVMDNTFVDCGGGGASSRAIFFAWGSASDHIELTGNVVTSPTGQTLEAVGVGGDHVLQPRTNIQGWNTFNGMPNHFKADQDLSAGATILTGTVPPPGTVGSVGNYYLDTSAHVLYGPKADNVPVVGVASTPVDQNAVSQNLTFGLRFQPVVAGRAVAIRFWRMASTPTVSRVLKLWPDAGTTPLAVCNTTAETGSGWVQVALPTPVVLTPGTFYRVGYDTPIGDVLALGYAAPTAANPSILASLGNCYANGLGVNPVQTDGPPDEFFADVVFEVAPDALWSVVLKSVPPGGTAAQVLAKATSADFDTAWSTGGGGGGGVTDHGLLTGLLDDDHTQYHTDARGDLRYDPKGTAAAAVTAHAALADPHPVYLTSAEGTAAYAPISHAHALGDLPTTLATDAEVTAAITTHDGLDTAHSALRGSATPVSSNTGASVVGVATKFSREDHKHQILVGTPVALGSANADGVNTNLARADHVHIYPTAANVGADPAGTAASAVSTHAATAGHEVLSTTTPADLGVAAVGNGTTTARSNHVHKMPVASDVGAAATVHTHTQAQSHNTPDTDSATTALHHTLGTGANQAAAGNHAHAGVYDPAGTATSAVSTHEGLPDPHVGYLKPVDVLAGTNVTVDTTTHTVTINATGGSGGGGTTILSGTATPSGALGNTGDYYLDSDDRILYGPKAAGSYGAAESIISYAPTATTSSVSALHKGMRFRALVDGRVTALRFNRAATSVTTSRLLGLWSDAGALLGSATTSGETGSGWITVTLASSVPLTAGQFYRVGYDVPANGMCQIKYSGMAGITSAHFDTFINVYSTVMGTFPATAEATDDPFADIVFEAAPPAPWPVALRSVPAGGATTQVLAKTTATDFDLRWAQGGSAIPPLTVAGALTVKVGTFRWYNRTGSALTIRGVWTSVGVAPTGGSSTVTVDVNINGTTIFTTQTARPSIAVSTFASALATPAVTSLADGAYITVDVDSIGSTAAGSDLMVQVLA